MNIVLTILAIIEPCWNNYFWQIINSYDSLMTNLVLDVHTLYIPEQNISLIDDLYNFMLPYMDYNDPRFPSMFVCSEWLHSQNDQNSIAGISWGRINVHWNNAMALAFRRPEDITQRYHTFAHELGHQLWLGHKWTCDNFMSSCNVLTNYNYTSEDWLTINNVLSEI